MGRQGAEILHRDVSKERERGGGGEREKEEEQRSDKQISEDRPGDRNWRSYIGISQGRAEV